MLGLYENGCKLMIDAVNAIDRGEPIEGTSQATLASTGNYFTFPTQDELNDFAAQGLRLVEGDEIRQVMERFYADV